MASDDLSELVAAPLGAFASSLAAGVAAAQKALDEASFDLWKRMETDDALKSLRGIGYQPHWYVIPEATAEIKLLFHFERQTKDAPRKMFVLPWNATVQSSTSLREEGTSQFTLKIVPAPPPTALAGEPKG